MSISPVAEILFWSSEKVNLADMPRSNALWSTNSQLLILQPQRVSRLPKIILGCLTEHYRTIVIYLFVFFCGLFLSMQDYIPSKQDMLLSRKATKGIQEYIFEIRRIPFRFFDVGGQRSQRQVLFSLLLHFVTINFIVFLISFDDYFPRNEWAFSPWFHRRKGQIEKLNNFYGPIIDCQD